MKKGFWLLILLVCFMTPRLVAAADAPVVVDVPPLAPAPLDIVTLKDGSILYGEVIGMEGGILHLKTPAGPDNLVKVKWESIAKLSVSHPIPFHLKEGTVLIGTATEGPNGTINVQAEPLKGTMEVPLDSITALNPIIQAPVIYSGTLTGGYAQATGNSHTKNASLLGDFVARGEQLRLTLNGRYVYSHQDGELSAKNARALIKMDFFITKRFFWFAASYFEKDEFQDLNLRTALSSGPGYSFIEKGDYESPWLNWPILDDRVTFYHSQEFYPESTKNYYMTMDNGVRFKLVAGFVSNIQMTTRYNSNPTADTQKTDNLYLLTLGYNFDTTRKR
jgi:putative salt-induced outer membrane protein YdiY